MFKPLLIFYYTVSYLYIYLFLTNSCPIFFYHLEIPVYVHQNVRVEWTMSRTWRNSVIGSRSLIEASWNLILLSATLALPPSLKRDTIICIPCELGIWTKYFHEMILLLILSSLPGVTFSFLHFFYLLPVPSLFL